MSAKLASMHSLLLERGIIKQGNIRANKSFATLLTDHGSLENVYHNLTPFTENPDELSVLEQKIEHSTHQFQVVTIMDSTYPHALQKIPGAPPLLYLQGDPTIMNTKTLGVVGTREIPSQDITNQAISLLDKLQPYNRTIVSGLALGCDTLAHKYALDHDLQTIAVLGTPLNKYYPAKNKQLQETIAKDHLVITPFAFFNRTFPSHFAHRNIVTAGLSQGLLVLYANDTSGTIHAVRFASAQGKPIYALPCNLTQGFNWVQTYNAISKQ